MITITVDLGRYRATVHYQDCSQLRPAIHTHQSLSIPATISWRLCKWCKPEQEDIVSVAEEITWDERYADAMSKVNWTASFDMLESIRGREMLSGGRTLTRKKTD